jgi:hypothetical protein
VALSHSGASGDAWIRGLFHVPPGVTKKRKDHGRNRCSGPASLHNIAVVLDVASRGKSLDAVSWWNLERGHQIVGDEPFTTVSCDVADSRWRSGEFSGTPESSAKQDAAVESSGRGEPDARLVVDEELLSRDTLSNTHAWTSNSPRRWLVLNPAQPKENFVDKWNEADTAHRSQDFNRWLRKVKRDIEIAYKS